MAELTPEEKELRIKQVRLLIGDTEASIFYPIFTDEEIQMYLELENWNVLRAARRAATGAAFILSTVSYRERTGDIEVWNNASIQYLRVLESFINDKGSFSLPEGIIPYAAGISKADVCAANMNPDRVRSPLAQIRTCDEWWRFVPGYNNLANSLGCGCSSNCRD